MIFNSKKSHISLNSFYLVTVLIFRIECQFLLDVNENNACQPENCVLISKCPSVLKLVFKVKSGDLDARSKLLELQCGFEKSLPKVCCQKNQATEAPRVFNSVTISSSSTSKKPKIRNFNSDVNATTPFTTPNPIEEVEEETTTTTTKSSVEEFTTEAQEVITDPPKEDFSELNDPQCGVRTSLSFRITLGQTAEAGQFPWIGALMYRNSRGQEVALCGGTLVSPQHLITAAHCDTSQAGFTMKSVILGQVDIGSPVRLPGLQVDIAKVVSHPRYTLDPVSINDIAMVKLVRPVSFTDMIRPICVFQGSDREEKASRDFASVFTVAGWGRTDRARSSSLLQWTQLLEVTSDQCSSVYAAAAQGGQLGPIKDISILQSQLCAQGEGGTDSCSGDSGGPLMNQINALWYLSGVVSFGTNECDSSLPGVYTNIEFFYDWILETIRTI